jgi:RNase P protein component
MGEVLSLSSAVEPSHVPVEGIYAPLTSLVGRTVIAANDIVSAWAMLYASLSGHSLPFVASLFDKWAREALQRDRIARIARDYLQKLPRELEQVESLLVTAEELTRERDLLVSHPWSIGHLNERMTDVLSPALRDDAAVEREAQFELLLTFLQRLRGDIMRVEQEFRASRDVEKVRVLNRSAVLAAELKFGKRAMPKTGPRHKEWHKSVNP